MEKNLESLKRQLQIHRKNLDYLQDQAAHYGPIDVPLSLRNQIEAEQETIDKLTDQLATLTIQSPSDQYTNIANSQLSSTSDIGAESGNETNRPRIPWSPFRTLLVSALLISLLFFIYIVASDQPANYKIRSYGADDQITCEVNSYPVLSQTFSQGQIDVDLRPFLRKGNYFFRQKNTIRCRVLDNLQLGRCYAYNFELIKNDTDVVWRRQFSCCDTQCAKGNPQVLDETYELMY